MSKQLRRDIELYIAPHIWGVLKENDEPYLYDELKKRELDPTVIEDKITIYEREVNGWFLEHAKRLKHVENTGFVMLMIAISYIEGVQQYIEGKSSNNESWPRNKKGSKKCFNRGVRRIFALDNVEENMLNNFYDQVRCGLFHTGMTKSKVIIKGSTVKIIDFSKEDRIVINQRKFLNSILKDFQQYIKKLRDIGERQLRENFDKMFNVLEEV